MKPLFQVFAATAVVIVGLCVLAFLFKTLYFLVKIGVALLVISGVVYIFRWFMRR